MAHLLALVYQTLVITEDEEVDPHLIVHVPPVQQQNGGDDCNSFCCTQIIRRQLERDWIE